MFPHPFFLSFFFLSLSFLFIHQNVGLTSPGMFPWVRRLWREIIAVQQKTRQNHKDMPSYVCMYIWGLRARQHLRSLAPVMNDYDGQMIFGDLVGLKRPHICLTCEEKPRKNLTQDICLRKCVFSRKWGPLVEATQTRTQQGIHSKTRDSDWNPWCSGIELGPPGCHVQSAKWIAGKHKEPSPSHLLVLPLVGWLKWWGKLLTVERRNVRSYFANKYLEWDHWYLIVG